MLPDVREWLPANHLAWFVIDAVGEMNLDVFYAAYRLDGRARPAYDPAMMVALLLSAYARGTRSSRVIERACLEDVAFRVIAAQQRPDHATIARFVERHQQALAGVFGEVLMLCARSGLAQVGVLAVDGTKVQANASRNENLDYEQLAREIVEEAIATDAAEDERYGDRRGDELPPEFSTSAGRRGWLREAKKRLEAERSADPQPVPRDRPKRVKQAKRRLDEELWTEVRANQAYEAWRAQHVARRRGAGDPGGEQERRLRAREVGEALRKASRVRFRGRVARASHELHDALGPRPRQRPHRVDRREKRCAPRRHPDDVATGECQLQVGAGGDTEVVDDAVVRRVHRFDHDRFAQAVGLLERVLEPGLDPLWDDHRRADDALLLGLLEQTRDTRLGDVQPTGDLRLAHAVLVIQPRHLRHQSQLLIGAPAGAVAAIGGRLATEQS